MRNPSHRPTRGIGSRGPHKSGYKGWVTTGQAAVIFGGASTPREIRSFQMRVKRWRESGRLADGIDVAFPPSTSANPAAQPRNFLLRRSSIAALCLPPGADSYALLAAEAAT